MSEQGSEKGTEEFSTGSFLFDTPPNRSLKECGYEHFVADARNKLPLIGAGGAKIMEEAVRYPRDEGIPSTTWRQVVECTHEDVDGRHDGRLRVGVLIRWLVRLLVLEVLLRRGVPLIWRKYRERRGRR